MARQKEILWHMLTPRQEIRQCQAGGDGGNFQLTAPRQVRGNCEEKCRAEDED